MTLDGNKAYNIFALTGDRNILNVIEHNFNTFLISLRYGGDGDDKVFGGPGKDDLWGGEGEDRLYGNYGSDVLRGQGGDDILIGGDSITGTRTGGPGVDKTEHLPV